MSHRDQECPPLEGGSADQYPIGVTCTIHPTNLPGSLSTIESIDGKPALNSLKV